MLRRKQKSGKWLARNVLAALLCAGGLHGVLFPAAAEAADSITVTGVSGSADPYTFVSEGGSMAGTKLEDDIYLYHPEDPSVKTLTLAFTAVPESEGARVIDYDGAYSTTGNVSGHTVNVSGENTRYWSVTGGEAQGNAASGNRVTVSGGEGKGVYGGYAETGNVTDNLVTVSGGSVWNCVYGGVVVSKGDATGNKIEISGGKAAFKNIAEDSGDAEYSEVIGGSSFTSADNEVTISGGTVGNEDYRSDKKAAPVYTVAGGDSLNGSTGNKVTIKGNATVYANTVIGGFTGLGEIGDIDNEERVGDFLAGGDAAGNQVTVEANAGSIGTVCGGLAFGGNATGNTVTLSGGSFEEAYGGLALSGILLGGEGSGASADTHVMGNADNNTVNISGTAQVIMIAGGAALPNVGADPGSMKLGTANHNTVNIGGGTFGGTTTVIVDEDAPPYKGYLAGEIYGGMSLSEASGNTVTVSGGKLDMATICGGIAGASWDFEQKTKPQANDNTVNILAPVTLGALLGGVIVQPGGMHDYSSGAGNTLNVAAKNVTAVFAGGFQNMNFYLPRDIANGDTMLTVYTPKNRSDFPEVMPVWIADKYNVQEDGTMSTDAGGNILSTSNPTDLTDVTFGVAALQGVNLEVGNTVNLIVDKNGLKTDAALKTADSATLGEAKFITDDPETYGVDDEYNFTINKVDNTTIAATVTSKEKKRNVDEMKSPAETRESVMTMVNMGADLLAGSGMRNAADAAAAETSSDGSQAASGTGGFAPFAAVGGSSLRAESGSHVNTKGIGLALGFAREIRNSKGKLLFGPVVEYGYGRYDSYQDDGTKADGKAHYWGLGVIAKQTNDSGLYYEGSLRVGRTGSDYNRNEGATHADYDSKATYFGAHLGIGKLVDIGHKNTLDYYGKYFYSHTGGDDVTIYTNAGPRAASFGSVDSHRLRVGARVIHEVNEKNKIYGGLGYQYEFKGDARVTYNNDGSTPSPSVKGSSGLIELGWQVKPGKSPMVIDLGVTGWIGKQRGVTANLQAAWTF